jgi:hypothetical protein
MVFKEADDITPTRAFDLTAVVTSALSAASCLISR